ncbi:hypothetical protein KFE26_18055 [Shewanella sp. M16]|uniref:hypothetical protein n=1 Tax=Shewanella sp. M16 TaxID=2830837 RepID=UPI001BAE83EA|nr:hypothetical protein [Shewanella sp. M16]MBS0044190.1 hypothetical protein [Shewanella sp. M16]
MKLLDLVEIVLPAVVTTTVFVAWVVCGSGLQWIYPKQHAELLELVKAVQPEHSDSLTLLEVWQIESEITKQLTQN